MIETDIRLALRSVHFWIAVPSASFPKLVVRTVVAADAPLARTARAITAAVTAKALLLTREVPMELSMRLLRSPAIPRPVGFRCRPGRRTHPSRRPADRGSAPGGAVRPAGARRPCRPEGPS